MTGEFYDKTERWKLILIECNTNEPEQAVTIVRLRKKDNAPVVSAPSCLQQFSFKPSFLRRNSTSQQMTLWLQLGSISSVSTPFRISKCITRNWSSRYIISWWIGMTFLNQFTIEVLIGWLFSARSSTRSYDCLRIRAVLLASWHSVGTLLMMVVIGFLAWREGTLLLLYVVARLPKL